MTRELPPAEARRSGGAWSRLPGLAAVLVALLLALPAGAQQGVRIAYVDMKRLLDNAPQLVEAQARLTREFQARNLRFESERLRLRDLEARQLSGSVTGEAAVALAAEVNSLRRSVERDETRAREELQKRLEEEIDRAFPRLSEAVADYAREQGYDLVLTAPVVYASGRIDITDAVVDRLRRDAARGER
jgi:outer membrane protein